MTFLPLMANPFVRAANANFCGNLVITVTPPCFGPCTFCHGEAIKIYLVVICIAIRHELIGAPGI